MNTIMTLLAILAVIALLCSWIASRPRGAQFVPLANVGEGTYADGLDPFTADNAFAETYSLGKLGAAVGGIDVCGVNDTPFGVVQEAAAAGDGTTVEQLGKGRTKLMRVAAGGVTFKDRLVPAAAGRVAPLSEVPGTYWVVGVALGTQATTGDLVHVADCQPHQVTVES